VARCCASGKMHGYFDVSGKMRQSTQAVCIELHTLEEVCSSCTEADFIEKTSVGNRRSPYAGY